MSCGWDSISAIPNITKSMTYQLLGQHASAGDAVTIMVAIVMPRINNRFCIRLPLKKSRLRYVDYKNLSQTRKSAYGQRI